MILTKLFNFQNRIKAHLVNTALTEMATSLISIAISEHNSLIAIPKWIFTVLFVPFVKLLTVKNSLPC